MKPLDINKSIYDLSREYPELIDIMRDIGFTDITKPFALKTAGKVMTIPKGCQMKGFNLSDVAQKLIEKGFDITD